MKPGIVVRAIESGFEWLSVDEPTTVRSGDAVALAEVANHPVVLLLPAQDVTFRNVKLPASSPQQRELAAPYAVEDLVADDINKLEIVVHLDDGSGETITAIVKKNALEDRLMPLINENIPVAAVLPESLCIPTLEDGWSAIIDGERMIARRGYDFGFGAEIEFARDLLSTHYPGERTSIALLQAAVDASNLAGHEINVDNSRLQIGRSAMSVYLEYADISHPLNLLPRSFRHSADRRQRQTYHWAAAALLLVAAISYYGHLGWRTDRLETQAGALRQEQQNVFSAAFPHVKRIVNIRAQARNEAALLSQSEAPATPFLDLLHAVGVSGEQADGAIEFINISYNKGALNLTIKGESVAVIEGFGGKLMADAFDAEILSAETRDNSVRSRIRVARR